MRIIPRSEARKSATGSVAFTLVEIMIVVGILGMVLAMAMPSFIQSMRKDPLRLAVSDIVEGCSKARALAILQGVPAELIIRAVDGQLTVAPVRDKRAEEPAAGEEPSGRLAGVNSMSPVFSARLNENVAVTLLYLNLKDQMHAEETRIHFYPNGTSDEFAIVLQNERGTRKISLECVTGFANVEVIR